MIREHSAGGVVFRRVARGTKHEVEWLIAKHSGYHQWVLPKGIVEEGEEPESTAVREVAEETGVTARVVEKLTPVVRYHYRKGSVLVDKRVEFFLMEYESGSIAEHSFEMEDVQWLEARQALERLAFEGERAVVAAAVRRVTEGVNGRGRGGGPRGWWRRRGRG